ncbi:MAG: DegT/DnrJ/EryC1/StrS family aminotransferase [Elusimicrobia bacterium]|nr:DegT/DnrJ/EryC1/StrS family aminotransferase [Elusimicrobiota bacterium]
MQSSKARATPLAPAQAPGPRRNIPSIGPSITKAEIELVTEAVTHGWYGGMSRYIDLFTQEFSGYLEVERCLPVSHGTAAVHLAMAALELGPGDEVIVPDITWVASAAPAAYLGAKVVLVDIDPETLCLCPEAFEKAITRRTKAVVVVDLLGNMPAMDRISKVARKHGVAVIEDAAEALGAQYRGRMAGTLGDLGVFSFNATKLAVAGQGGALVTNDPALFERAKLLAHHGIDKRPGARYYWSTTIGFNYNWTNIQAALALAQLRRLEELLDRKARIFRRYEANLAGTPEVRLNRTAPGVRNTYWLVTAILGGSLRVPKETVQDELKAFGIDARPFFYPISSMPPYKRYCDRRDMAKKNPVAYSLSPYGICLPCAMDMTEADVDYVCDRFLSILAKHRK